VFAFSLKQDKRDPGTYLFSGNQYVLEYQSTVQGLSFTSSSHIYLNSPWTL